MLFLIYIIGYLLTSVLCGIFWSYKDNQNMYGPSIVVPVLWPIGIPMYVMYVLYYVARSWYVKLSLKVANG